MSEIDPIKPAEEGVNRFVFIAFCGLIPLLLVVAHVCGLSPVRVGNLADSDCYMHLIRASDLYNFGHWYNPILIKSNAPYGEGLHWSRPFDVLLLLGAVPLGTLIGFEAALFWWGVLISPILMALTLIILNWSTRFILSKDGSYLVVLIFLFQAVLLSYFQAARPDHHSLLVFTYVLSVGLVLRIILKPFTIALCYATGAVSALTVWISVESMLSAFITVSVLALLWVLEEEDFLRKGLHYSLAFFIFSVICLAFERPLADLAKAEFDRLSIVHISILGFAGLFWVIASIAHDYMNLFRQRVGRLCIGLLGIGIGTLAIWLLFPRFYNGPFAKVDPRLIAIMFNKIAEVQPLLSKSVNFTLSLQVVGPVIIFCFVLFYILLRGTAIENRNGWIYITLSIGTFVLISLFQMRWAMYAEALLSIAMAALLCKTLEQWKSQKVGLWKRVKNSLIVLIFVMGFFYAGFLADFIFREDKSPKKNRAISLVPMCKYLNQLPNRQEGSLQILTTPDFGAEILYRTDHEVTATVNRYGPGALDTYGVMTADIDEKAYRIIKQRGIDVILICPESNESVFYLKPDQTSTFYQRIRENKIPSWLSKIELPDHLSNSFELFQVLEN